MVEFLVFLTFILTVINFCLLLSILRTTDNNVDLLLDLERNFRKIRRKK